MVRLERLERVIQTSCLPLQEIVPLLAALFSISMPDKRYPPRDLDPQQ